MEQGEGNSLRSKRLSNEGRAMLGNAGGARSTREGKPCSRFSPCSYTARAKLLRRLLRKLGGGRLDILKPEAKVLGNNIEYT